MPPHTLVVYRRPPPRRKERTSEKSERATFGLVPITPRPARCIWSLGKRLVSAFWQSRPLFPSCLIPHDAMYCQETSPSTHSPVPVSKLTPRLGMALRCATSALRSGIWWVVVFGFCWAFLLAGCLPACPIACFTLLACYAVASRRRSARKLIVLSSTTEREINPFGKAVCRALADWR
jgi:hypothetical protein